MDVLYIRHTLIKHCSPVMMFTVCCCEGGLQFGRGLHTVKFILEQAMKAQKGSGGIALLFLEPLSLTLALDGVGCQLHAPDSLPPGKRPGTHCVGGRVGPRAGLFKNYNYLV